MPYLSWAWPLCVCEESRICGLSASWDMLLFLSCCRLSECRCLVFLGTSTSCLVTRRKRDNRVVFSSFELSISSWRPCHSPSLARPSADDLLLCPGCPRLRLIRGFVLEFDVSEAWKVAQLPHLFVHVHAQRHTGLHTHSISPSCNHKPSKPVNE